MGTHFISSLEAYCHEQAGLYPTNSYRWLFINLLEELTQGYLAYRPLRGKLSDLDDILEHYFWIFGTLNGQAYFAPFSTCTDAVAPETREWMKNRIRDLMPCTLSAQRAGEIVQLFNCETIGAISFGHDGEGWNTQVLYWHPFFTADVAQGLLRETIVIDDTT